MVVICNKCIFLVYKYVIVISLSFVYVFLEKENKAFHVSYNDRAKLAALSKQVKYGKFDETKFEDKNDVGFFDFIGNDRRYAILIVAITFMLQYF